MTPSDYQAILGVKPGATAAEIRKAYILRTKILHPDRFDPEKQPVEWKQANEMLRDLNAAYDALREGSAGPQTHSRPESHSQGQPPPPRQPPPRTPPPRPPPPPPQQQESRRTTKATSPLGPLQSGVAFWDTMSPLLRERLKARQEGKVSPQLHAPLPDTWINIFFFTCSILWLFFVFGTVTSDRWDLGSSGIYCLASLAAGAIFAWNGVQIRCAYRCTLKNGVFVTPLYVLRTDMDQVRYYPLWQIKDFKITHHTVNGADRGTTFWMSFESRIETFRISSKAVALQFAEALRIFDAKCRSEKAAGNIDYFVSEDDFRVPPPRDTRTRAPAKGEAYVWFASAMIGFLVLALVAVAVNAAHYPPIKAPPVQANGPPPPAAAETQFAPDAAVLPESPEPPEPMPSNGYVWTDVSDDRRVAPLQITVPRGGGNYFVKVEDWFTSQNVLDFFIRDGTTVEVLVPLGSDRIKYAVGQTWYGTDNLFGQNTSYAKASSRFDFTDAGDKYHGYTLDLILQPNGNLSKVPIKKSDF